MSCREGHRLPRPEWRREVDDHVDDAGPRPAHLFIDGVKTVLFCAWLSWSRFRVVLPIRDKTMPSFTALDVMLRRLAGALTYVLTDMRRPSRPSTSPGWRCVTHG
jgi:hypothetical protein